MILAGSHAGPEERARFESEARAAAALQHRNIIQIFQVGESAGLPFICMELVEGGSLSQKTRGTTLSASEAAKMVETLARAMYYAHQRGVIHRDLKPANVMLTAGGEPKITDFGLAKILQKDENAAGAGYDTQSGAAVGTPSYMAPEQASGDSKRIGPLVDVYALGAVLYELLTSRPPFVAPSVMETLMLVITEEPPSPSRLQPRLPRDLVTVCMKCLQKEPQNRYTSAGALADDLNSFLDGRPIHAVPVRWWDHLWKWTRRHPALAGSIILVTLTLGMAGFFAWQSHHAAQELRRPRAAPQAIPPDVRRFDAPRKAVRRSGEGRKTRCAGRFLATFKKPLHAEADAEQRRAVADRFAYCAGQSRVAELRRRRKMPDPRNNDSVCVA